MQGHKTIVWCVPPFHLNFDFGGQVMYLLTVALSIFPTEDIVLMTLEFYFSPYTCIFASFPFLSPIFCYPLLSDVT